MLGIKAVPWRMSVQDLNIVLVGITRRGNSRAPGFRWARDDLNFIRGSTVKVVVIRVRIADDGYEREGVDETRLPYNSCFMDSDTVCVRTLV